MSDFIFNNRGKAAVIDLSEHLDSSVSAPPAAIDFGDDWEGSQSYAFINKMEYVRQGGASVQPSLDDHIHFTSTGALPVTMNLVGLMVCPTGSDDDKDQGFSRLHSIADNNLITSSQPSSTDTVKITIEDKIDLISLLSEMKIIFEARPDMANVFNFAMSLFVLGKEDHPKE